MKTFEQIARSMYEAYRDESYLHAHTHNLAWWHQLSSMSRNCWIAAAKAAHKEITEVF